MTQNLENALAYSERWLGIIKQKEVDETLGKEIITESKHNFAEHFNRGWLEYRKSVTEAGDWAAVEWTGSGAIFQDVLGREYLDCLGGYGMLNHGWSHPDVVAAVRAQLGAHAHAQPGIDRSVARCAGAHDGRHHPWRPEI